VTTSGGNIVVHHRKPIRSDHPRRSHALFNLCQSSTNTTKDEPNDHIENPELAGFLQHQEELFTKFLSDIIGIRDFQFLVTTIIVIWGIFGILLVPYHHCGLHQYFAGTTCTCRSDGDEVGVEPSQDSEV
jgi:hypothetical protein